MIVVAIIAAATLATAALGIGIGIGIAWSITRTTTTLVRSLTWAAEYDAHVQLRRGRRSSACVPHAGDLPLRGSRGPLS